MRLLDNWNKEILRLAIPSIISNVIIPLLGLVDLVVVRRVGNETYISAIAVDSIIFNMMYRLSGSLHMGTSGMTSRAYGRQDGQECMNILVCTLTIGVGMGVLFIVVRRGIKWRMFRLMGTPEPSRHSVATYLRTVIWGTPAMLGLYGPTGWFIGIQDTHTPMAVVVLRNVVNILAFLFFAFVFDWKISSVAAGTALAQWAGSVVLSYAVHKRIISGKERGSTFRKEHRTVLQTILRHVFIMRGEWGEFSRIDEDIFLRTSCLVAVNFFFTSVGGKQEAMILVASILLVTLFALLPYLMGGFAYTGGALSGKYYGAGGKEGLRIIVRRLFGLGVIMTPMFTAVYVFGGAGLPCFLASDTTVMTAMQPYLFWAYLIPMVGVAASVLNGVFIGLTATEGMSFLTAMAMITFFVIYYLFWNSYGDNALWIAFLSFLGMKGLASILWACRYLVTI